MIWSVGGLIISERLIIMGYVGSVENDLNLGSVPDVLGGGTQDFTWWRFLAWVLLPLPVVLVVLLSAPAPRLVRRGVLRFVETLLVARVRGPIEIIHFALLIAGECGALSVGKSRLSVCTELARCLVSPGCLTQGGGGAC